MTALPAMAVSSRVAVVGCGPYIYRTGIVRVLLISRASRVSNPV
jgi:hypothetical protein